MAARSRTKNGPGGPPRVSVVMPCFRQAEYLPFAVASVLAQTYRSWEIVVVNDGSPDDTSAVVREIVRKQPGRRIRLLEQENAGVVAARNAGIAVARGELILPLDADDGIDPTFLEKTVGALDADPGAAIAFTDVGLFGAQSEEWKMGPFDLEHLRTRNRACCTSLYRRALWEALGGYNPNMGVGYEDWDFWIGAAVRGARAVHVQETLLFYRMKASSAETRNSGAMAHHAQLCARVVLNHPQAFSEAECAVARRTLAARPLPEKGSPAPPAVGTGPVSAGRPGRPSAAGPGPAASIVIAVFNQAEAVRRCTEKLIETTPGELFEAIFVDDASTDGTAEFLACLGGDVKVITNSERRGSVAAQNQGAAMARGRNLVFLDPEAEPEPGWLEALLAAADGDPSVGAAGARIVRPDGRLQEAGGMVFRDGTSWNFGWGDNPWRAAYAVPCEVDACSGVALCVRREAFETLGGFDAVYATTSYESVDLCFGLRSLGLKVVYSPTALVIHPRRPGAGIPPAGTDRDDGRAKFVAKWSATLAQHEFPPAPGPRPPATADRARRFPSTARP